MSFQNPGDPLNGYAIPQAGYPPANMSTGQPAGTPQNYGIPPQAGNGMMPAFPPYSDTTAELLARARANTAAQPGTAGYEAAREHVLKNLVTSDKLPIPSPDSANKRGRGRGRGRGGVARSPGGTGPESTPGSVSTPVSDRGRGRVGRPRGRGRGGGGRGGKRKRSESFDESDAQDWKDDSDGTDNAQGDDSDVSNSYTPLPAVTKSGRAINKPTAFVPTIPSPNRETKKRRPYRRNPEAALCKTCQRGHSPNTNQIVFCDGCGTAYHQYCHDPPIDNEVVNIQEKEWFCSTCVKSRENTEAPNADGMVSGETLSIQEKRSRLSTLTNNRLVELLLHASSVTPSLSIFPPSTGKPVEGATSIPTPPANSTQAQNLANTAAGEADAQADPYDGYDTDPPAHYPKPGNGIARTLRPESEDLQWLVDDNFEVFSHQANYAPDGSANTNGNGTAAPAVAGAGADVSMSGTLS